MELLSKEDLIYFTQQSNQNLETMLVEMAMLLNDTETKVKKLENQNWFQRMVKTIFGQNKITVEELKKNNEKIIVYIIEAIKGLYEKNLIDHLILLRLNEKINISIKRINNLEKEHLKLQDNLKIFIEELNREIESVDNYFSIISKKDIYERQNIIVAISDILSKIDKKIIFNEEKLEIIMENMKNWLNDTSISLEQLFKDIINLKLKEIDVIYLTLSDFRNNLFVDLILEVLERKFYFNQNEEFVLKSIFFENEIKRSTTLTIKDIFLKLLNSKKEFVKDLLESKIEKVIDNNCKESKEDKYLLFKAENGDGKSQYEIGKYFLEEENFSKSIYWFERAANQGNTNAIFELALLYRNGLGVKKDSVKSYSFLKKSALLGNINAVDLIKYSL